MSLIIIIIIIIWFDDTVAPFKSESHVSITNCTHSFLEGLSTRQSFGMMCWNFEAFVIRRWIWMCWCLLKFACEMPEYSELESSASLSLDVIWMHEHKSWTSHFLRCFLFCKYVNISWAGKTKDIRYFNWFFVHLYGFVTTSSPDIPAVKFLRDKWICKSHGCRKKKDMTNSRTVSDMKKSKMKLMRLRTDEELTGMISKIRKFETLFFVPIRRNSVFDAIFKWTDRWGEIYFLSDSNISSLYYFFLKLKKALLLLPFI